MKNQTINLKTCRTCEYLGATTYRKMKLYFCPYKANQIKNIDKVNNCKNYSEKK